MKYVDLSTVKLNLHGHETTCLLDFTLKLSFDSLFNKFYLPKLECSQSSRQGLLRCAMSNLGPDGWDGLQVASPSYQR